MRPGPSRSWAIAKPAPRSPSRLRGGHPAVLVGDLPVAGPLVVPHHRHRAHAGEARRVHGHEDHARALVRRGVGIGHDHRDRKRRAVVAGREPLVAVDHPLVAVELGARDQTRGVRAGALRLGHREARADLALEQRREPALLLLPAAVLGEDLHVAGIRRGAVEDHGSHAAAAHQLAEHPVLPVGEARPEPLVREEQVPEPLAAGALAQLDEDLRVRHAGGDLAVERGERVPLDRVDVLLHEPANALEQLDDAI